MISRESRGALIYLPREASQYGLAQRIRSHAMQEAPQAKSEAEQDDANRADVRDYGVGLQVLKDLGLSEVRLLTNAPKKTDAFNLRGFGLRVVDQVPLDELPSKRR